MLFHIAVKVRQNTNTFRIVGAGSSQLPAQEKMCNSSFRFLKYELGTPSAYLKGGSGEKGLSEGMSFVSS